VSIEVVRRRLGRASTETTQVYTLLADTEIRAARRKRETRRRLAVASGDPGLDREQDCLMSHHGRG